MWFPRSDGDSRSLCLAAAVSGCDHVTQTQVLFDKTPAKWPPLRPPLHSSVDLQKIIRERSDGRYVAGRFGEHLESWNALKRVKGESSAGRLWICAWSQQRPGASARLLFGKRTRGSSHRSTGAELREVKGVRFRGGRSYLLVDRLFWRPSPSWITAVAMLSCFLTNYQE